MKMSNTIIEDLLTRCLKVKEIIDASIAHIDSIRNDKAEEETSAKEAKKSSYEGADNIIGKENGSKKEKNKQPKVDVTSDQYVENSQLNNDPPTLFRPKARVSAFNAYNSHDSSETQGTLILSSKADIGITTDIRNIAWLRSGLENNSAKPTDNVISKADNDHFESAHSMPVSWQPSTAQPGNVRSLG
nr:hypothetical protein [Tanacetum cinerariifolium]